MREFVLLSEKNRGRYMAMIEPLSGILARTGLHPNALTWAGLVLSGAAGCVYATGSFFWGGCLVVFAGTCDVLDGETARRTGKSSPFGAFLDSTLDRFGEALILLGLAWCFSGGLRIGDGPGGLRPADLHSPLAVALVFLAMTGSFLVSYTRARAEGLGAKCKKGFMQRPERMILLVVGSLLGAIPVVGIAVLKIALVILAIGANWTAVQRIIYVRKQLSTEKHVQ